MARRRKASDPASFRDLPAAVTEKLRPPLGVILGAPAEVAELCAALGTADFICYQMDLYQADRLRSELGQHIGTVRVVTAPDLWDLPADFQTLLYPASRGSERSLKIDMIEQAYHLLQPHGTLIVWSAYETDQFFPALLKKTFGRVHAPAAGGDTLFWCQRAGERPRRRHEVTFQCRIAGGPSLRFLSRPGTFSYGRFDEGARALLEVAQIEPGDHVLDIGCGCGTNGSFAWQRCGPDGSVTFVDSNVRAVALTEENARNNGVKRFKAVASAHVEVTAPDGGFDVALANPPYFAQGAIARLFVDRSAALLKPGGRFYVVTKQPNEVGPMVVEAFGYAEAVVQRGYTVFGARAKTAGEEDQEPVFDVTGEEE
jgi:16S rRNA (guanine1207-N2)-methyltransferase